MRAFSTPMIQLYTGAAEPSDEFPVVEPIAQPLGEVDQAEWLACRETWRPFPSRNPTSRQEPFTLPWFEEVEKRRYARHGKWIPKYFEFKRHRGDKVLGLGDGLGTDWVNYARHGATVFHCASTLDSQDAVRRNFELRGLMGNFQRGQLAALPYAADSMDVVCLSTLGGTIPALAEVVEEAFRVLKPGGKLLAALPAKYSAQFWSGVWLPWRRMFSDAPEDRSSYSVRRVKRLLGRFAEVNWHKRHLRRSDVPHLWRWMLLPVMERLMGRFLVIKTFKPVAARGALRMAA